MYCLGTVYGEAMVNFAMHRIINYFALIVGFLILLQLSYAYNLLELIFFTMGYILGTELITPDLDITSRAYNNWGLLKIFWYPYKLIANHRGESHTIEGTILRLLYAVFIIFLIYSIIVYAMFGQVSFGFLISLIDSLNLWSLLIIVLGVVVANVTHVVVDML